MASRVSEGTLASYVDCYVAPDSSTERHVEALTTLVMAVETKQVNLTQVVECLGEYLTNVDDVIRGRGTLLLAEILTRLPTLSLPMKQLHHLLHFFMFRLQDAICLGEVLKGLTALLRHHTPDEVEVELVARALFAEVHVESQVQSTRKLVFDLLDSMFDRHLPEIKRMKEDFVLGFIQAMDGERDPRNLVVCFRLARRVAQEFPEHAHYAEDLFDITSCYFPITFTPPPNDTFGIRREDLILGLRAFFTSSSAIASHFYPFMLEKLASKVIGTREEALTTIAECIPVHGLEAIKPFLTHLWSVVCSEVLNAETEILVKQALLVLRALVLCTATPQDTEPGPELEDLLASLFSLYLRTPEGDAWRSVARMLQATASACSLATTLVLRKVIPKLCRDYEAASDAADRRLSILEVTNEFVRVTTESIKEDASHPLREFTEPLLSMLQTTVESNSDPGLRMVALRTWTDLAVLPEPSILDSEQVSMLVERLLTVLLSETNRGLRSLALTNLTTLVGKYPQHITSSQVISRILSAASTGQDGFLFRALSTLSSLPTVFHQVLPKIMEMMKDLLGRDTQQEPVVQLMVTLNDMVTMGKNSDETFAPASVNTVALPLLDHVVSRCLAGHEMHDGVIEAAAGILRCITQSIEPTDQQKLARLCLDVILHGKLEGLGGVSGQAFSPLSQAAHSGQAHLVPLLLATVGFMARKCQLPGELAPIARELVEFGQQGMEITHLVARQCLASLFNKYPVGKDLTSVINTTLSTLVNTAGNVELDSIPRCGAVQTMAWLLRGLAMRIHDSAVSVCEALASLLGDNTVGLEAARAFETVVKDSAEILNESSGALIMRLFKQKFFVEALPRLMGGGSLLRMGATRAHQVMALTLVIRHIPRPVLLPELPKIFPLTLQELQVFSTSDQPEVKLAILEMIDSVIPDVSDLFGEHLPTLVPVLLNLTTYRSSMRVRIGSLRVLRALTILPYFKLHPFKREVITQLAGPLDDKKREVRKEAVRCRNVWFLLGEQVQQ